MEMLDAGGNGWTDSTRIAVGAWRSAAPDFARVAAGSANARRLLGMADLAPDVAVCLQREVTECVPVLVGGRDLVVGRD